MPPNSLNFTHDPAARSWLESAQSGGDFPIQNLPYGRFRRAGDTGPWHLGVAIGDQILDLTQLGVSHQWMPTQGVDTGLTRRGLAAVATANLRNLMRLGPPVWHALRAALFLALRSDADAATQAALRTALVAQSAVDMTTAVEPGEYTDFYTSLHHARNVGQAIGNGGLVTPNFFWMPIAYHGRASSLGVDQRLHRPMGQMLPPGGTTPVYGACQRLDYELEMAIYVGQDNAWGRPVSLADAPQHIFGMGLLNDWSARDIQFWEMAPLGPFQGKNFATSLSPWVVTMEALAPFRLPFTREADQPSPLPYLDHPELRAEGALDIGLSVSLQTRTMREAARAPQEISRTNFRHQYWCVSQMVVQHTVGGCNLHAGDILGTGTVSGPTPGEAGAMIELTMAGKSPITVGAGETRGFLEDGDRIQLHGRCERAGAASIGFGYCTGEVLPAYV